MADQKAKKADPTRVLTGKVRLSYVNLLSPRREEDGEPGKYGCVILIPKTDTATVKALRAAIEAAKEKDKGKWNGKIPRDLKITLRDGDEEFDEEDPRPEIQGHFFMNVSSNTKPGVVDNNVDPITDPEEIYSGCYARVAIKAAGYNANGNRGITFYLDHVQKLADGDFLGGRTRAEDVFDAVEPEEGDEADESVL